MRERQKQNAGIEAGTCLTLKREHKQDINQEAEIPATVTTAVAALALNRKPATLNRWAWTNTGPVKPVRINRRLAWPTAEIMALLRGGAL
jgi:hypothetical protein